MIDRLLNEKEAAAYLGILESKLKELVNAKKISAYKIGGQFLRFDSKVLEEFKAGIAKTRRPKKKHSLFGSIRDYLYYNDFYIIVAILILILLALVFRASF